MRIHRLRIQRKWHRFLLNAAVTVVAAGAGAGCDQADEFGSRSPASGTISLDGVPLKTGRVLFIPLQDGPAVQAKIVDGAYHLPTSEGPGAGPYRVEIHGEQRPTGKKFFDGDENALVAELKDIVPDSFNTKSTLQVEIKPNRENVFSYQLETPSSKEAPRK